MPHKDRLKPMDLHGYIDQRRHVGKLVGLTDPPLQVSKEFAEEFERTCAFANWICYALALCAGPMLMFWLSRVIVP